MKTLKEVKKIEGTRLVSKLNDLEPEDLVEYLSGYRSILQGVKSKKYLDGNKDAILYLEKCMVLENK